MGEPAVYSEKAGPAGAQTCANCGVTKTPLWRHDKATGQAFCNACGIYYKTHGRARPIRLQKGALPVALPAGTARKASAPRAPDHSYCPPWSGAQHARTSMSLALWPFCTTEHKMPHFLIRGRLGVRTPVGHERESSSNVSCVHFSWCQMPQIKCRCMQVAGKPAGLELGGSADWAAAHLPPQAAVEPAGMGGGLAPTRSCNVGAAAAHGLLAGTQLSLSAELAASAARNGAHVPYTPHITLAGLQADEQSLPPAPCGTVRTPPRRTSAGLQACGRRPLACSHKVGAAVRYSRCTALQTSPLDVLVAGGRMRLVPSGLVPAHSAFAALTVLGAVSRQRLPAFTTLQPRKMSHGGAARTC